MKSPLSFFAALLLFLPVLSMPGASQSALPLGTPPKHTTRTLTEFPNSRAVLRQIWVPGLDDGYVPQGLTTAGGQLYVSAYRSESPEQGRGPCRLFRVSTETGAVTGRLDLPSPCGHAGGLAKGPSNKLYVADTRIVFEVTLTDSPSIGRVTRSIKLTESVKGSFAAGSRDTLWLGSYERGQPGQLQGFPFSRLKKDTLSDADTAVNIPLPSEAQGAGFDPAGRLWISRSGSRFGEILRLDVKSGAVEARYAMPIGLEDLSFAADGALWTLSEAGSKRWLGWSGYHPLILQFDIGQLR
jgi:hypothetical protein